MGLSVTMHIYIYFFFCFLKPSGENREKNDARKETFFFF